MAKKVKNYILKELNNEIEFLKERSPKRLLSYAHCSVESSSS